MGATFLCKKSLYFIRLDVSLYGEKLRFSLLLDLLRFDRWCFMGRTKSIRWWTMGKGEVVVYGAPQQVRAHA